MDTCDGLKSGEEVSSRHGMLVIPYVKMSCLILLKTGISGALGNVSCTPLVPDGLVWIPF